VDVTNTLAAILLALASHESNGNDRARGAAGEVSRYQIMPAVWASATKSRAWTDPQVSAAVATRIITQRIGSFSGTTHRLPTGAEIYALWNAPGLFARRGYQVDALPSQIRNRCDRFAATLRRICQHDPNSSATSPGQSSLPSSLSVRGSSPREISHRAPAKRTTPPNPRPARRLPSWSVRRAPGRAITLAGT